MNLGTLSTQFGSEPKPGRTRLLGVHAITSGPAADISKRRPVLNRFINQTTRTEGPEHSGEGLRKHENRYRLT